MAWENWSKDKNEEPQFPTLEFDKDADYANPELAALRNGAVDVVKSALGVPAMLSGIAGATAPSVSADLDMDMDGYTLLDPSLHEGVNQAYQEAHDTTAPVWNGIENNSMYLANSLPKDLTPSQDVGPVRKVVDDVIQNAPQMAFQAGMAMVNPALSAAMMGATIGGGQYVDLRNKGVDPLTAGQAGLLNAAIQTPLEYVPMEKWLNARKVLSQHGLLKAIGSPMLSEGVTEAIQEIPDEMTSYYAEHGTFDGFNYGKLGLNAAEAGIVGAVYGGLFAGINAKFGHNEENGMNTQGEPTADDTGDYSDDNGTEDVPTYENSTAPNDAPTYQPTTDISKPIFAVADDADWDGMSDSAKAGANDLVAKWNELHPDMPVTMTSGKRNRGDGSHHDDGDAIDFVCDAFEGEDGRKYRDEFGQLASDMGLTPLDEYDGSGNEGWARGENYHVTVPRTYESASNRQDISSSLLDAIGGHESGGDYTAVNGDTGAYGKYQITDDTWNYWAPVAGLDVSAEKTPENQEKVAKAMMDNYVKDYGVDGAIVAWYGGPGLAEQYVNGELSEDALNRPQPGGPSINEYVADVKSRLGNVIGGNRAGNMALTNGNTSANIPEAPSAEDFLRDIERSTPLDTDENVAKSEKLNDVIENGSQKQKEGTARELGWEPQQENTQQSAPQQGHMRITFPVQPKPNVASNMTSVPVLDKKNAPIQMYKTKNDLRKEEKERQHAIATGQISYSPRQADTTGVKATYQTDKQQTVPQAQSFPQEAFGIYNHNTPQQSGPLYQQRGVNGIADRQRQDRWINANKDNAKTNAAIAKALKNSHFKGLVKQAFVNGDEKAKARLDSLNISPDVLEAVKEQVIPDYVAGKPNDSAYREHEVTDYTPQYKDRNAINQSMQTNAENSNSSIDVTGYNGEPIERRFNTPQEAMQSYAGQVSNANTYSAIQQSRNKRADADLRARIKQEKKDKTSYSKYDEHTDNTATQGKPNQQPAKEVKGQTYSGRMSDRDSLNRTMRSQADNRSQEDEYMQGGGTTNPYTGTTSGVPIRNTPTTPSEAMRRTNQSEAAKSNGYEIMGKGPTQKAQHAIAKKAKQEEKENETIREKERILHSTSKDQHVNSSTEKGSGEEAKAGESGKEKQNITPAKEAKAEPKEKPEPKKPVAKKPVSKKPEEAKPQEKSLADVEKEEYKSALKKLQDIGKRLNNAKTQDDIPTEAEVKSAVDVYHNNVKVENADSNRTLNNLARELKRGISDKRKEFTSDSKPKTSDEHPFGDESQEAIDAEIAKFGDAFGFTDEKEAKPNTEETVDIGHVTDDSDEAIKKYKAQVKAALKKSVRRLNMNGVFDPDIWLPAFHLGLAYVQKGINTASKLGKQLLEDFGEDIRPWINSVWESIRKYPKNKEFSDKQMALVIDATGKFYFAGKSKGKPPTLEEVRSMFSKRFGKNYDKLKDLVPVAYAAAANYKTAKDLKAEGQAPKDNYTDSHIIVGTVPTYNKPVTAKVFTESDKEFNVTYKIKEAYDIISSNDADFAVDGRYPKELQPRDRTRDSMKIQVDRMSQGLRPEALAANTNVNEVAPIINSNNVVENGNGRTMAIKRAYSHKGEGYEKSAKTYKQYLVDHAEEFGYTKEQVESMKNPILVRERSGDSDKYVKDIVDSKAGGMNMGAAQQAKSDAKKITVENTNKYKFDGSGDLTIQDNRDFVVSTLNAISSKNEQDVLYDDQGNPSKAGIERVRNAMAAAAYNNDWLISHLGEDTDNEGRKGIMKGLAAAAPRVANIGKRIESGNISKDYDLPKVLSDALALFVREDGNAANIEIATRSDNLIGPSDNVPEVVGDVARFLARNKKHPNVIANTIADMVANVNEAVGPMDDMFSGRKPTLYDCIEEAIENHTPEISKGINNPKMQDLAEKYYNRDEKAEDDVAKGKLYGVVNAINRRKYGKKYKEDTENVQGGISRPGRPVEVGKPGTGEAEGNREPGTVGGHSSEPDRTGGRAHGKDTGNSESTVKGNVQGRPGENETGHEGKRNDSKRNAAGGTEKPVISPHADEVEANIDKGNVKSTKDLPGQSYVPKSEVEKKTAVQRAKDNIEAIKVLKKIHDDNRDGRATAEEQELLAKYSGFGGLSSAFKPGSKLDNELKSLLSKEEYNQVRAELISAFYTPPEVVKAMWKLADRLGFNGGRVLDPSCGTGNFFAYMPENIKANSQMQGVELSTIPFKIAENLFQGKRFKFDNKNYRDFKTGDGTYDLAITNVPFSASVKLASKKSLGIDGKLNLHDYYFAKTLNKLRPGGIAILMTSGTTLNNAATRADSSSNKLFDFMRNRKNVEFIGAIRLPTDLFAPSARVTTDVIVLRKLDNNENATSSINARWEEVTTTSTINIGGEPTDVNSYFAKNENSIVGEFVKSKDRWGKDTVDVSLDEGRDLKEAIEKSLDIFPKNVYKPEEIAPVNSPEHIEDAISVDNGSSEGDIFKNQDGKWVQVRFNKDKNKNSGKIGQYIYVYNDKEQNKVDSFFKISSALGDVLKKQVDPNATEEDVESARNVLRSLYRDFKGKYGCLNDSDNAKLFADSPQAGRVLALENYKKPKGQKRKGSATEADILNGRTAYPADNTVKVKTTSDALVASLLKCGNVNLDFMSNALKKSKDEITQELGDRVFKDPVSGNLVTKDEYLSGNVRIKLDEVKEAAKKDPTFNRNVKELEKVIPKTIPIKDISIELGSPIVSVEDTQRFVDSLLGGNGGVRVYFNPYTSKWRVDTDNAPDITKEKRFVDYGISSFVVDDTGKRSSVPAEKIIENMLNGTSVLNGNGSVFTIKSDDPYEVKQNKEKAAAKVPVIQKKINDELRKFIMSDSELSHRIEKSYNYKFNSDVLRNYDGSLLTFPWMNKQSPIVPRKHQKDAVWRTICDRAVLYAHCVGSGKTFTMQAAAMELRRMGLAHKIVITTPKNVVRQMEKEFYQVCPGAKILVLDSDALPEVGRSAKFKWVPKMETYITSDGNESKRQAKDAKGHKLYVKQELSAEEQENQNIKMARRNATIAKIMTNDWDAIIMSHETFERIPVSDEYRAKFIQDQLDQYRAALEEEKKESGKSRSLNISSIEQMITNLEDKLEDILHHKDESNFKNISFEELGIDQLFVDEADQFKNLQFPTRIHAKGVGTEYSARAEDMFLKTQYLEHSANTHGVVFATGTPISNSIAELYSMDRYMANDKLNELGLGYFDRFAKQFISIDQAEVPKQDGSGFEYKTSVLGVKNAPELIKMFRSYADVKTIDDLPDIAKKRPKANYIQESVEETGWLKKFKKYIRARSELLKRATKKNPSMVNSHSKASIKNFKETEKYLQVKDSGLLIANDFKTATLAPGLFDQQLSGEEGFAKVYKCAENIYKEYKRSSDRNGAQLVFCDMSSPNNDVSVYKVLKERLIEMGIPSNEIAFAHDAGSDDKKKQKLFEAVDTGKIRVLIGSTLKMGAGTNMQHKLVALHHLDCPWRPRDIEQREGRILRQGNENAVVNIYNYVAKGTYDINLWDLVRRKAKLINQIMHGDPNVREALTEGVDENNFEQLSELANADPLQKEYLEVNKQVRELEAEKSAFEESKKHREEIRETYPHRIEQLENNIVSVGDDVKYLDKIDVSKSKATINGETFDKHNEDERNAFSSIKESVSRQYGKLIRQFGKNVELKDTKVGNIAGFDIYLSGDNAIFRNNPDPAGIEVYFKRTYSYRAATPTIGGVVEGIKYIPKLYLTQYEESLKTDKRELEEANNGKDGIFKKSDELDVLTKHRNSLKEQIDKNAEAQKQEDNLTEDVNYLITDRPSPSDRKAPTDSVLSNFPNAQNVSPRNDGVDFDLPNGSHVAVNFTKDAITIDRAKASKDYGRSIGTNERAASSMKVTASRDGIMTLTLDAPEEAPAHEAFHLAMQYLTDREKSALKRVYKNEEAMAEGMRAWKIARKNHKGTLLGRVFQKINDFAHKLLGLFHENDYNVYRKISEGQMWERKADNEAAAKVSYMINPVNSIEKYLKANPKFVKPGETREISDGIYIKGRKKETGWGFFDKAAYNTIASPSRSKDPAVKRVFGLADKAMRNMQTNFGAWTKQHASALKLLDTKKRIEQYNNIMLSEDAGQVELSDDELRKEGVDEKVIQAHDITRKLLKNIYEKVNDEYTKARVSVRYYTTYSDASEAVKDANDAPYKQVVGGINEVHRGPVTLYSVAIKSPQYAQHSQIMDADDIRLLKKDKYNRITKQKAIKDKKGFYEVHWESYAKPLANKAGYIPHFFHGFLVINQSNTDPHAPSNVIGSGTTLDEAIKVAERAKKEMGGDFLIVPKSFNFEDTENPLIMGDKDYNRLLHNLTEGSSLSLNEARNLADVRKKGRKVFYGSVLHRSGAKGFETNVRWAIQHHIATSARYVALNPFKADAINFFERAFGDYDKNYAKGSRQEFVQGYIKSVLGNQGALESAINSLLRKIPMFANMARPAKTISVTMQGAVSALKLGASPAAAFVNLLQVFNLGGYVGMKNAAVGIKRAINLTMTDKKILKRLGTDEEVGLEMDGDYGRIRLGETKLTKAADTYRYLAEKSMFMFTKIEHILRRAATLAAYYDYINKNKDKILDRELLENLAGKHALEINRKVNFDYSVADAPRVFRALNGTIVGDAMLQFQKYGVKELEVIKDFLPFNKETTTKQKLQFFVPYLLIGGLWNALPFEDLLLSLIGLFTDGDPKANAQKAMMEWAGKDTTKQALVRVANYGAGGLVGADISQRVGLKGAVPETDSILKGGAIGSTAYAIAHGILNADANEVVKGTSVEAGNLWQAFYKGYGVDSKGRKTIDYSGYDRALKALGFRTTNEAEATDVSNIVYNYKQTKQKATAKAKQDYLDGKPGAEAKLKAMGKSSKQIREIEKNAPTETTRVGRSTTGLSKEDKKNLKGVYDYVQ